MKTLAKNNNRKRFDPTKGMRTFLFLVGLLSLISFNASAVPCPGLQFSFSQPDGSKIAVVAFGDEYFMRYESTDGYTLIKDPDTKWWSYAVLSKDMMQLHSSGIPYKNQTVQKAQAATPAIGNFQKHVTILPEAIQKDIGTKLDGGGFKNANDGLLRSVQFPTPNTVGVQRTGRVVGITIYVDFSDEVATHATTDIGNLLNQVGYSANSNNGSVRDFYYDVSNGNLDYQNRAIGIFRPAHPRSYYDALCFDENSNPDPNAPALGTRARELVNEALIWADNAAGQNFDFSMLTTNGTRIISLSLIYEGTAVAGHGLWPHRWSVSPAFNADGVDAGSYLITDIGNTPAIGTFCHEAGHMVMNWPDLYDYTYLSNGVGSYCLMGAGNWNNNRLNPAAPNPFFRYCAGWVNPVDITYSPNNTIITAQSNSYVPFIYTNSNTIPASEMYLIENREASGRNEHLPDHGLLIWHSDLNGNRDAAGLHTCATHYVVSVVQADGAFDLENNTDRGGVGDLFHQGGVASFTDNTDVNSQWWCPTIDNNNLSYLSISNIGPTQDAMTFTYSGCDDIAVTHPSSITYSGSQAIQVSTGFNNMRVNLYSQQLGINLNQTTAGGGTANFNVNPNSRVGRIWVTVTGGGRRYHGFIEVYNPAAITIMRNGSAVPFSTIAAAVAGAQSNETINVASGTYDIDSWAEANANVSNVSINFAANTQIRIVGPDDGISLGSNGHIVSQANVTFSPQIFLHNTIRAADIPAPPATGQTPTQGAYPFALFGSLCKALNQGQTQQTVRVGTGIYSWSGISDVGLVGVLTSDPATSSRIRMGFPNSPSCIVPPRIVTSATLTVVRNFMFEINEDVYGSDPAMTIWGPDINIYDNCIFTNTTQLGGVPGTKGTVLFSLGSADPAFKLTGSVQFNNCNFNNFHNPITAYDPMTNAQSPILSGNFIGNNIDIQFRDGSIALCGIGNSNISSLAIGSTVYRGSAAIQNLIGQAGCSSNPAIVSLPEGAAVDGMAGDFRLPPTSGLIGAGTQNEDIGAIPFETVFQFHPFLDVNLISSLHDTLCIYNGQVTKNTFGANIEVAQYLTLDLCVVKRVRIKKNFGNVDFQVGVRVSDPELVPPNLPDDFIVWDASINQTYFSKMAFSDVSSNRDWVSVRAIPDAVPPAQVRNVTFYSAGNNNFVSWDANIEPDLMRYKIFRVNRNPQIPTVQIASCSKNVSSVVDTNASGVAISYKVVAYDLVGNQSDSPYDIFWRNKAIIRINTSETGARVQCDGNNFPIRILLTKSNFCFSEAQPNGADIRFTTSDCLPLSFEVENWDIAKQVAVIWVKVPVVYGNNSSQYFLAYWGNPTAASASQQLYTYSFAKFESIWPASCNSKINVPTLKEGFCRLFKDGTIRSVYDFLKTHSCWLQLLRANQRINQNLVIVERIQ